jgi:hypothetical protein
VAIAALFLLLINLPLAGATPGTDAGTGVTVQLLPAVVDLQPGDSVPVELLITNSTQAPVEVTAVDVLTPLRMTASDVQPSAFGVIAPGTTARGEFELRADLGSEKGQVVVLAQVAAQGAAAQWVTSAGLEVTPGEAPTLPEISFLDPPTKLNDGQDQRVTVRIANTTPFAFEDVAVVAPGSDDVQLTLDDAPVQPFTGCSDEPPGPQTQRTLACLEQLPAGATHHLDVLVTVDDQVRTGTHRVAIMLVGERSASGGAEQIPSTAVVSTTDIELAVFGVDAISPLGVGTLFVLPGALAVVTFLLLNQIYPRAAKLPDTLALTDLRAWPPVVSFAALAYVIAFLVRGRNLTDEVGTSDVVTLFVIGLALGFLVWGVMAVLWHRRIGRKLFTLDDSPEETLERLAARKAGLNLPAGTVSNIPYLYLARGKDGKWLAAPPITYRFLGQPSDEEKTAFRNAIGRDDAEDVRAAGRRGLVSLQWRVPAGIVSVDESAATLPTQTAPLVIQA